MNDVVVFSVNTDCIQEVEQGTEEDQEHKDTLYEFMTLELFDADMQDEDPYIDGQPFEKISAKMKNSS